MPPGSDTQLGVDEEGQFVIYTVLAIAAKNGQSALMDRYQSEGQVCRQNPPLATQPPIQPTPDRKIPRGGKTSPETTTTPVR